MQITIRKTIPEDRQKLIEVEKKSTPGLSYVPNVFDMFISDSSGEFITAELDGEVVACGKFTLVPDGSAWLETLRVIPECQGLGIGKRFYQRFFELAQLKGVKAMRMYTGLTNVVSKGLAERFGFTLEQSFKGAWLPCSKSAQPETANDFQTITDPDEAAALVMSHSKTWGGFMVMNRTFYPLSPALCADLARRGCVFAQPESRSVLVAGARFMPEQALHIGMFAGDPEACLRFAMQKGLERQVGRLSCLFPAASGEIESMLGNRGFTLEPSTYIVMGIHL